MPFYYNAATTSETKYLADCSAVVCLSHNPYAKFASPHGFVMSSETADAFEGYLDNFTGVNGGLTRPITLEEGKDLSCSCATVRARCGLLQNKLTLAEERFAMLKEAPRLFAPERSERFGRLRTQCPDARFNTVFNYWAEKQVSYCAIGKKLCATTLSSRWVF